MQSMLDGLVAFHDIGAAKAFISKAGADVTARAAELVPGAEHPVVRTHPDTGRKHLYVNRGFTRHIVGLAPDESDTLLELLFRHCEQPNVQIRHHWSPGDVVMWDELPTQHFATADHFPQRREMARITVASIARPHPVSFSPREPEPVGYSVRRAVRSVVSRCRRGCAGRASPSPR